MGKRTWHSVGCSALLVVTALGSSCGGKAVVDGADGSTSSTAPTASSSSSSSSSSTTSSTGAGGTGGAHPGGGSGGSPVVDCYEMLGVYIQALEEAQRCDVCNPEPVEICVAEPQLVDYCGCPVSVNVNATSEVATAVALLEQLLAAGCGPEQCGKVCPGPEGPWTCYPIDWGCNGQCGIAP